MLDSNLAADEGKLDYLARTAAGQDAVVEVIREEKPLEIPQVFDRFKLHTLLGRSGQGTSFLGSYLYYFGMLTLKQGRTATRNLELVIPNEVVRGLYWRWVSRRSWSVRALSRLHEKASRARCRALIAACAGQLG